MVKLLVETGSSGFTPNIQEGLFNAKAGDAMDSRRQDLMALASAAGRGKVSSWWADEAYNDPRIAREFDDEFYQTTANAMGNTSGSQPGFNAYEFLRRKYGL